MRFPYGETVTVLREQRDPTTGVSTLVVNRSLQGCAADLSPFRREPTDASREWTEARGFLYAQPGSGLVSGERVRFGDGTTWEVTTDVVAWRSPLTGWTPGDYVSLKRVTPPL